MSRYLLWFLSAKSMKAVANSSFLQRYFRHPKLYPYARKSKRTESSQTKQFDWEMD
jgi:hypothetical protein